MKVDTILSNKNYSCFENMIYNLANLFETKHQCIFMDSWSFYYTSNPNIPLDETLCDNRHLDRSLDDQQSALLDKYHGLNIKWISVDVSLCKSLVDMIKQNDTALIIEMDTQYVNWYQLGQIFDVNHYFLIVYIDDLKDIYCLDGHFSKELQKISSVDFNHVKRIGLVKRTPITTVAPSFIQAAKHAAISCNEGSGMLSDFQMMRLFANDLMDESKLKNIYKPDILNSSTIVRKIHYISNGRHNIYELLESLNCDNQDLKNYILEALSEIILKWHLINNLMIKWLYQNKVSILHAVADKFLEISSIEEKLTDSIISYNEAGV